MSKHVVTTRKDGIVYTTVTNHSEKAKPPVKTWAADPQQQIIALLAEQNRLLIDIKSVLANQLKRTAPYHTGPQQVSIAPVPQPVVQDPPPPSEKDQSSGRDKALKGL